MPHKLEPGTTHPFLWILEEVFGLTDVEICAGASVTRPTLIRLREMRDVSRDRLTRLAKYVELEAYTNYPKRLSPPPQFNTKAPPPQFRHFYRHDALNAYRKAIWKMVREILAAYAPPPLTPDKHRDTDLSVQLLSAVGNGTPRVRVKALLKRQYSTTSIRRARERLGIREAYRDGRWWWYPPENVAALPTAKLPPPKPIIRTSPRASQIQQCLELYLVKRPTGADASTAIEHVRSRTSCSRAAVFRAARDLKLIRETTGFASNKRTTWTYQAAIDALHVKPATPTPED